MLLTPFQASLFAWTLGGVCAAAGLWIFVALRRRDNPLAPIPAFVLLTIGLVVAASGLANGTALVIVTDGGTAPIRTDRRLYGSRKYQYANGQQGTIARGGDTRTIVVNDTPVTLVLETVRYGSSLSSSRPVAPYSSVAIDHQLEFFGPTDRPPARITASGGYETEKYWLRW